MAEHYGINSPLVKVELENNVDGKKEPKKEPKHTNPFEGIFREIVDEDKDKGLEEFQKILATGNLEEIFLYIGKVIQNAHSVTVTPHFEKGKTDDEHDVEDFIKSIQSGYFNGAMGALNKIIKKSKQEKKNRRSEIYG